MASELANLGDGSMGKGVLNIYQMGAEDVYPLAKAEGRVEGWAEVLAAIGCIWFIKNVSEWAVPKIKAAWENHKKKRESDERDAVPEEENLALNNR